VKEAFALLVVDVPLDIAATAAADDDVALAESFVMVKCCCMIGLPVFW
jgi:hypothetical protein